MPARHHEPKNVRSNSADAGSKQDIAKYFVLASIVRAFIPADHSF
jgi:hypothetical protein